MLNCPLVEARSEEAVHPMSGWVFELDGRGTVLHSRAFPGTSAGPEVADTFGVNFFEDVDGFEDMPVLKARF